MQQGWWFESSFVYASKPQFETMQSQCCLAVYTLILCLCACVWFKMRFYGLYAVRYFVHVSPSSRTLRFALCSSRNGFPPFSGTRVPLWCIRRLYQYECVHMGCARVDLVRIEIFLRCQFNSPTLTCCLYDGSSRPCLYVVFNGPGLYLAEMWSDRVRQVVLASLQHLSPLVQVAG